METNVNYTAVGVFVIGLVTAIILGIIWLSSGFSFEQYKKYMVYMQESVSGLSIDSPVEYNGVNVGSIKSIELNEENPQLVEVLLNIKKNTPITRGTIATLNTRGLTGLTFIALKDRSTDLRPLVAEPGEPYPIIPTTPSIFVRLDTALSQMTKSFKSIAESIQHLLDKDNLLNFKKILANLQVVTGEFAANDKNFTQIMNNTVKISEQMTPLLQSSTQAMLTLRTQTLPDAYQLLNSLNDVTRNLSTVSQEIKQNPSILLRGVDRQTLGPGERK